MNPHQYQKMSAYRKTHSCETTLIRLTEDWKMAADNKEYVTVLSTDMSKAFDSLHPALMIQKLKPYGFSEKSLNLLRSFLERRRNRVKLQEAHSARKEQKRGCRQGSSLGSLLWNLFQNDLSLRGQSANLFMYADDHQIYTDIDIDIQKAARTLRGQTEAVSTTLNGECTSQYDITINNNYGSLEQFVEVSHIQYTYITKEHHSTCLQCIMNISI